MTEFTKEGIRFKMLFLLQKLSGWVQILKPDVCPSIPNILTVCTNVVLLLLLKREGIQSTTLYVFRIGLSIVISSLNSKD